MFGECNPQAACLREAGSKALMRTHRANAINDLYVPCNVLVTIPGRRRRG